MSVQHWIQQSPGESWDLREAAPRSTPSPSLLLERGRESKSGWFKGIKLKAPGQPQIQGARCVCAFSPQTPVSWLEHMHQHAWGCVTRFLEQGGLGQLEPRQPRLGARPCRARSIWGFVPLRYGEGRAQKSPRSRAEPALEGMHSNAGPSGCGGKAASLDLFCCRGAEGGGGSPLLCWRVSAEPGPTSIPAHPAPPCRALSWALGWGAGRGLQAGAAPHLSWGWEEACFT